MTQTSTATDQFNFSSVLDLGNWISVLGSLLLIAVIWGGPVLAVALAVFGWKLSKIRYHVGSLRSDVPVQTYRTKARARQASIELYRAHGRCFRITRTR